MVLFGGGTVNNAALIKGLDGIGFGNFAGGGYLINSGTILATYGQGVQFSNGGSLTNQAAGLISGAGYDGAAAVVIADGAMTVSNAGTIYGSRGIYVTNTNTLNQTIIDSGTISAIGGTAAGFAGGNDLIQFQPSTS